MGKPAHPRRLAEAAVTLASALAVVLAFEWVDREPDRPWHREPANEAERAAPFEHPSHETLILSTPASASLIVRTYDVGDLIRQSEAYHRLSRTGASAKLRWRGDPLWPLDEVVRCIVSPESWASNTAYQGGSGRAALLGDQLIVVQSSENHEQVARLLRALRDKAPHLDQKGAER